MSAGYRHTHPIRNEHHAQLARFMADSKFVHAVADYRKDDENHDVPYLGGSDNKGTTVFFDRRFADAVKRGKIRYGGNSYDPRPFVRTHEAVEGAILRGQYNPKSVILIVPGKDGFDYPTAHDIATAAEQHAVHAAGLDWNKHQQSMQNIIRITEAEKPKNLPPDLLKAPYQKADQSEDAGKPKLSHKAVHYGQGMPKAHCGICQHFVAAGPACRIVQNPILPDGWCDKFRRNPQAASVPHGHPILRKARQAKDGKFYVPDAKRPGKFLLVVHHA